MHLIAEWYITSTSPQPQTPVLDINYTTSSQTNFCSATIVCLPFLTQLYFEVVTVSRCMCVCCHYLESVVMERPSIPVLVILRASYSAGVIKPAVRELQVGCIRSTQPSKKVLWSVQTSRTRKAVGLLGYATDCCKWFHQAHCEKVNLFKAGMNLESSYIHQKNQYYYTEYYTEY